MRFRPATIPPVLLAAVLVGAPKPEDFQIKPTILEHRLEPGKKMLTLPVLGPHILMSRNKRWAAILWDGLVPMKAKANGKEVHVPLGQLTVFGWTKTGWRYAGWRSHVHGLPLEPEDFCIDEGYATYMGSYLVVEKGVLRVFAMGLKHGTKAPTERILVAIGGGAPDAGLVLEDNGALELQPGGKVLAPAPKAWPPASTSWNLKDPSWPLLPPAVAKVKGSL